MWDFYQVRLYKFWDSGVNFFTVTRMAILFVNMDKIIPNVSGTFFSLFADAYIVKKFQKIEKCLESTSYDWAMEASRKCENEEYYHCLHDVNNRDIFYEFCGDFITVRPECVGNTYQDKYLKSSELNNCFKRKQCNDIGQLVCEDGSKTEDRRCKCDISKGMVIKIYGDSPIYQCVKKCETSDCSTTSSHDVTETTLRPTTGKITHT
ncbi:hypothetical protein KUTeg_008559 [Tegillarca granosa]|uniref:Uncharacterized protein n=1 Tax=Tegillarca granosa TaxID=220873 RepID=A0ABQ9F9F9_TEGGR|nr:hypothetical protein KUTeg_008559 [Tegillarca granosa]